VNAINSAVKKGFNLKGAEMYINLEPCSHFGKTPPCVDKIIKHKFSKVVIGMKDPNPLVSGRGIRKLKQSRIDVKVGVLENQCRELNRFFFKYVQTGLPYVTIKTAQTLDGKIADKNYNSKWISSLESRKLVHKMRSFYDAVLIGSRTAEHDNPELTVRYVEGRNPYRIVIDLTLKLNLNKKIFLDKFRDKTIVMVSDKASNKKINLLENRKVKVLICKSKNGIINLKDGLKKLASLGISSIMVEGGAFTNNQFLKNNLFDAIMIFIAPKIMGKGISAFNSPKELSKCKSINYYKIDSDIVINIKK
jgi:diaminohydroxyphosphoribosylaminopyrimidine deaminase/5-amino-6-(5-phosphoribosylamino)uracil reductase